MKHSDIHSAQALLKSGKHKACPMYANDITQLAYSLEVYLNRDIDVYDFDEAYDCLIEAGYDFEEGGAE